MLDDKLGNQLFIEHLMERVTFTLNISFIVAVAEIRVLLVRLYYQIYGLSALSALKYKCKFMILSRFIIAIILFN